MREQLQIIIAACFYYSGLVWLAHRWRRRGAGQRLIILKYHRAAGPRLRQQLFYLKHHYRILPLEAALEELYASSSQEKSSEEEQRELLVVTFDDGYRDNYTHAFTIARELGTPFTIFLPSTYLENGSQFWWIETRWLVRYAQVQKITIDGRMYHLEQPDERDALYKAIDAHVMYAPSIAQREAFLADMRKALDIPADAPVEEAALPLTWQEVGQMDESGLVSFGGHTMNHPILACVSDPAEVHTEVEECRRVIEHYLGHPVRTFAYPIGSLKNIGDEALRTVKEVGYTWAVSTTEGVSTPEDDPYLLKRVSADDNKHWLVMASELVGLLPIVSRLKKLVLHYPFRRVL